jgi:hypothetical protein
MPEKERPATDAYPSLTYRDVATALSWLEGAFGL